MEGPGSNPGLGKCMFQFLDHHQFHHIDQLLLFQAQLKEQQQQLKRLQQQLEEQQRQVSQQQSNIERQLHKISSEQKKQQQLRLQVRSSIRNRNPTLTLTFLRQAYLTRNRGAIMGGSPRIRSADLSHTNPLTRRAHLDISLMT